MVFNSDIIKKDLKDAKRRIIPKTTNDIFDLYIGLVKKIAHKKDIGELRRKCESIISESLDSTEEEIIDYSNIKFMNYFMGMIDIFSDSDVMSYHREIQEIFIIKAAEIVLNVDDLLSVSDVINAPRESWSVNKSVFVEMADLTDRLEGLDIPKIDHASIVLEIINRNISAKILEQDSKDIRFALPFIAKKNGLTDEELDNISAGKYDYVLMSDYEELSDLEKGIKIFMKEILSVDEGIPYIEKFLNSHRIVKEHYFDKMDDNGNLKDFDINDVYKIDSALKELGVNDKVRSTTKRFLAKDVSKKSIVKASTGVKIASIGIPQQEYIKLRKEVEKLYNIRSGKIVRPLSIDEVYYCAGTMLEMGEEISTIETLFDRGLKKEKDPVKRFESEHDKWVYYGEKFEREDQINEMNEIYQEAINSSEEDKKEWSKMLGDCLTEFEFKIPVKCRYEYEINKAKEFVKKRD